MRLLTAARGWQTFLDTKMKRKLIASIITLILLFVIDTVAFAQSQKVFYMKGKTATELSKYIGQRIKFPTPKYNIATHNPNVFTNIFGGKFDEIYTFKSVKGDKTCQIELTDESGQSIVMKVAPGYKNNALSSMDDFFLVDLYETEENKYLNKVINNSDGQPVAKIVKVFFLGYDLTPDSLYIKSDFDNTIVRVENMKSANELCQSYGKILTHPLVKSKYRVVGSPDKFRSRFGSVKYNIQNIDDPNDIRTSYSDRLDEFFYREDLKFHYNSSLVKVEKPANPAIRYGKTTKTATCGRADTTTLCTSCIPTVKHQRRIVL